MDAQITDQQTNVKQDSASREESGPKQKHTTPQEQLCLQGIHEFREASLKSPEKLENHLLKCLGPVFCDLLEYLSVMKSEVDEILKEEQSPSERLRLLQDVMADTQPVHRQVDRYAQLICRIRDSGKPAKK